MQLSQGSSLNKAETLVQSCPLFPRGLNFIAFAHRFTAAKRCIISRRLSFSFLFFVLGYWRLVGEELLVTSTRTNLFLLLASKWARWLIISSKWFHTKHMFQLLCRFLFMSFYVGCFSKLNLRYWGANHLFKIILTTIYANLSFCLKELS